LRGLEWGWLVLLVVALMVPCAMAQLSGKGAITGTVTDKNGAVIPGAVVTAIDDATGTVTKMTTTGAGDFNFSNLDPGIYTVSTTAKGFEKLVQKNIHVNAMEMQAYNPALVVGGGSVEIVVTDQPPQLETSNATLGSTMEQDTYAELPIEMGAYGQADQRRATDFVYLMPGVQGNVTNGNATTNVGVVNGSGSKGAASSVYVDGVLFVRAGGNGDPRFVWTAISVDAIDQFQVQTNGYSAVYEGQGVMNYTVKQGGNKQHGSVYEFFRNTSLDTWGFWGKAISPSTQTTSNPTGYAIKPVEHSNEYGINLGGPLLPFGSWKDKIFYFGNYNGYRYTSATPTTMTFPTALEQAGNFQAAGVPIYDPLTQATCTANSTNGPCRYRYGYGAGASKGLAGNPVATGAALDVIPSTEWSPAAKALQSFLPSTGIGTAISGNYVAQNPTGLVNWSTTDRIDYAITSADKVSFIAAIGRQASSVPVGQATSGRNVGPVPYNYGQAYAPKTAVGIIEETHVFTQHLINQLQWGFARYNGPTFTPDTSSTYQASNWISGLPAGQAQSTFPIVAFGTGTGAPTQWNGTTANSTIANNYTVFDNVQWTVGKHSFTFGGQIAWMLYNTYSATGGSTPITLTAAAAETEAFKASSNTAPAYTLSSGGQAYASFLLGDFDKGSFTDYSAHPGYGARFRPISPYVQDNWKVSQKLTLDLGLRYDFFPSVTEQHDAASFFDPSLINPITGINGALNFTGHGTNTCNCDTPVKNYYKNFGPRVGFAYQLDPKTVLRGSWGVMFTHGDAVGGNAYTLGTLGFSAAPSFSSTNSATTMTGLLNGGSGAIPAYTSASGSASGPAYGTGYTTTTGYTAAPSSMTYDDPYMGGRAPEYINWTLGFQRQLTNSLAFAATYVGSEGHFLQLDSMNARGQYSNQLDPKYLYLGSTLSATGASIATACTTYGLSCPSGFNTTQSLATALKPHPFQSISDSFGYVGNASYHGLQATLNMRSWHGLIFNANYTYSRAIDDGGTFRSGYALPVGTVANNLGSTYKVDSIERQASTSNQPQHLVVTAVWDWPLGKTVLSSNRAERAVLGGFKFSGIYQAYSGSPLAITASSCQTNPSTPMSSSSCAPTLNKNFFGSARQNGKWGWRATTTNYGSINYIVPSVGAILNGTAGASNGTNTGVSGPFISPVANLPGYTTGSASTVSTTTSIIQSPLLNGTLAPAYTFGDAARTAPYGLSGPGNYQLDLAMVRSFPLHITAASKLNFRAEWYNVTNHTLFGVASTVVGNSSFGQVGTNTAANRKAVQFSGRIEF
jgi:hypothetical protein